MGVATCRNLHMLVLCLQSNRSAVSAASLSVDWGGCGHPTSIGFTHGSHPTRSECRNRHPPGDAADAFARDRAERAAQLVLAAVTLLAWGDRVRCLAHGPRSRRSPRPQLAWMVGSSILRDRGEYHRALAVRLVRHAQAATLVTALVVAAAALLDTGAEPLRLVAASLFGFLAVAGLGRAPASHADDREPAARARPGRGRGGDAARATPSTAREAHGVELVGFVGNHSHAVVPVLGELDELARDRAPHDIDAIVLTANRHRLPLLEHLLGVSDRTPAVLELSDLYERAFGCVPVEEINAAWFIEALTLHRRLQASLARRSVDIAVAALAAGAARTGDAARRARHQARLARPGLLPPGARGRGRPHLHDHQVPLDAHRCRGRRRAAVGVRARPARHPRRRVHPPLPHRRAAPAVERRAR